MTEEDDPSPPSLWVQAARRAEVPPAPVSPRPGPSPAAERRDQLLSVGLGVLAGGGAVLLLGALLVMFGR